jgi:hypothetical protein
MNEKNLGQSEFLIKALFIVIAAVIFIIIINYFASFRYEVMMQKEESNFKISVLNTLQKLVSDETCLSYKSGNPQKPILSREKIELFASEYKSKEPSCAKAFDFDYAIRIEQLPYNFTLYPGEKKVVGEIKLGDEFSSHPLWGSFGGKEYIPYFDCNFRPEDHPELCKNTELDGIICEGCKEDPKKNCPYPYGNKSGFAGICCIYYACPKDACECYEAKPGVGDCGSGCVIAKNCDVSKCKWYSWHGACGMTFSYTLVPSGENVNVNLTKDVWEFGLSFGQAAFSPPKARTGETQLSLPITIKYNETFSTEGVIYIYAVRGELEELSSLLEDVCSKAEKNNIKFTKQFHFSYPIKYYPTDKELCMGTSCKLFECSYGLEFQNIEKEGDYILEFSFSQDTEIINVRK